MMIKINRSYRTDGAYRTYAVGRRWAGGVAKDAGGVADRGPAAEDQAVAGVAAPAAPAFMVSAMTV